MKTALRKTSLIAMLSALALTGCSGEEVPAAATSEPVAQTTEVEPVEPVTPSVATSPEVVARVDPTEAMAALMEESWEGWSDEQRTAFCQANTASFEDDFLDRVDAYRAAWESLPSAPARLFEVNRARPGPVLT